MGEQAGRGVPPTTGRKATDIYIRNSSFFRKTILELSVNFFKFSKQCAYLYTLGTLWRANATYDLVFLQLLTK